MSRPTASLGVRFVVACVLGASWLVLASSAAAVAHRRPASRALASEACPDANAPVSAAPVSVTRAAVVCLVNEERRMHGLPALRSSVLLNRVAQRQTHTMVSTGYFGHGPNFTLRFSAVGYNWRAAGENIASGYATPRSVVAAWMASPGHCRNILDPTFRDVGTGVAAASVGADVGPGTWTQDFGLLMNQSAPSANTGPQADCPY